MADLPPSSEHPLLAFADLMRVLRDNCAWKQEQTHVSLRRFLLEESYEAVEAIDEGAASGDWSHLREELGDVLLQVYFHALIAEERGDFTLADVAADIDAKMRRRNPHVIGPDARDDLTPVEIDALWQRAKQAEKAAETRPASPIAGVSSGLPALMWASKVVGRIERGQVEVVPAPAPQSDDEALGDELLALVERARHQGVDAEQALRDAVRRRLPRT